MVTCLVASALWLSRVPLLAASAACLDVFFFFQTTFEDWTTATGQPYLAASNLVL
jgi:hypothetical protein